MTEFYAQPYSIEHSGFYFDSVEKFEAGMERLNKQGCEEVEIQFIDGSFAGTASSTMHWISKRESSAPQAKTL